MTTFSVTPTVAEGMLNSTGLAQSMGASPLLNIYSGTQPANAAAALSGNTLLAQLVCAATPLSTFSDTGTAGQATFGAIATESSANATGTATFFRLYKSDGTTSIAQGDVGTSAATMILNTVAISAGSQVSISSGNIQLPYGP